jgi:hypothetical protein
VHRAVPGRMLGRMETRCGPDQKENPRWESPRIISTH